MSTGKTILVSVVRRLWRATADSTLLQQAARIFPCSKLESVTCFEQHCSDKHGRYVMDIYFSIGTPTAPLFVLRLSRLEGLLNLIEQQEKHDGADYLGMLKPFLHSLDARQEIQPWPDEMGCNREELLRGAVLLRDLLKQYGTRWQSSPDWQHVGLNLEDIQGRMQQLVHQLAARPEGERLFAWTA